MLNHTGVFITCSLSYTNNHRQLTKCRVHHFTRYVLPKTRTDVLALSLWPSFPANSLWCKPRGVIQSVRKYWTLSLCLCLCTYKTLHFSKNYELRHGWPVYNFLAIARLRKLFRAWLFELHTKFCVDPYPKREFHKKLQVVGFSIAGHILNLLVLYIVGVYRML